MELAILTFKSIEEILEKERPFSFLHFIVVLNCKLYVDVVLGCAAVWRQWRSHGITTQNNIDIFTAVRTSDITR
jgi:hypothetical protein